MRTGKEVERKTRFTRETATADQLGCWDCVESVFGGDHHLGPVDRCGDGITTKITYEVATFDGDKLTRMVLLSHRDAVRLAITPGTRNRLTITAHPRRHGYGGIFERHPDLVHLARCAMNMDALTKKGGE